MLTEKTITENIIFDSPMNLPQAVLYGVHAEGNTRVLGTHADVYALLERDLSGTEGLIGIAVHTTGWAAPLNPETGETDMRPSEHPERRRIVLVVTLTMNGFCSGMKFARKVPGAVIEETNFDEESASGDLWEALNECFDKITLQSSGRNSR